MEPLTVLALIVIGGALLITAVWLNNRRAVRKLQERDQPATVRLSDIIITDQGPDRTTTSRHRRDDSTGRRVRRDDTTDSILYGSLAAANTTHITDTSSCDTSSSTDSGSCGGGE